jgi:hypothetical protein
MRLVAGFCPLEGGQNEFAAKLPVMLVEELEPNGPEEGVGHARVDWREPDPGPP